MIRLLRNVPISIKAFSASAVLLICIVALGTQASVFLSNLKTDLKSLSDSSLSKQQQVLDIAKGAIDTHIDVFRYVAWASTGVKPATLKTLEGRFRRESAKVSASLGELAARADLTAPERVAVTDAATKWQRYADAAHDTVEISTTDPALGTVMLGGIDDEYSRVDFDIQTISSLVTMETRSSAQDLFSQAGLNQRFIVLVGLAALLFGAGVTFMMSQSIVAPIQAVTRALQAVSVGGAADVKLTDRSDEIGKMWRAISVFRRKLESDNRLLGAREQELTTQNLRFDAALNNMSQGLVMFDRDNRVTVANRQYIEMYRISADVVRPGRSLRHLLEARQAAGTFGEDIESYMARQATEGFIARKTPELPDGRVISVVNTRMSDGGWVSTHEDITEQRRTEQRIAHMAGHDALTGLPNRLLFRESMEQALAAPDPENGVAVLSIDLDCFKEVNDTHGHPAGDALLRGVAERLRRCVGDGMVARLGGDEFAMIRVGAQSAEDVQLLAERILKTLGEPMKVEGHDIRVGSSIGIAISPAHGDDPDELLKHADTALYRAKADGRRTFRLFEPEMNLRALARRSLEADLRGALDRGEFELHYQPFVNLVSNQVTGFEALIRWHHPDKGLISPADFIPLAEETGLINPIGDWVLRQACLDAATWPADLQIAVNLSPVQLRNRALPRFVILALAAARLDPKRLELEITETALLQDDEALLASLHHLRALGVRIAMDDFGTGYSSLKYLRSFPFDKIKIDRSFVKELGIRADCAAIVRAVAELGRSLAMTTTAEGVETEAQLAHLKQEGCTEVQGYLFSKPRPATELATLISTLEKGLAA
ncbi:MAG TPA: EAL domain-containing protein [Xanthobacteraceae bacterium]|jgi:diguanylate cyclase (GGDEF)-like protein|nr:EAL domain-containing protein [Xanthobacteraceae bacterium]